MTTVDDWFGDMLPIDSDDYDNFQSKLAHWRKNGFVVFENVIDHGLIDDYLDELEFLKKNHKKFPHITVEVAAKHYNIDTIQSHLLNTSGVKYNSLIFNSDVAARLSVSSVIVSFLRHVFLDRVVALQSLTFEKGSQQPVHVDFPYVRTQTKIAHLAASWIPLEDVHNDSGPLEYYPGSHKLDLSGFFDFGDGSIVLESDSKYSAGELSNYLASKMKENDITPVTFYPKKGDVLIWHGRLVHGGTKINDNSLTRKSHVSHYTSMSAFPSAHMKENALLNGEFFENRGGYVMNPPWPVGNKILQIE